MRLLNALASMMLAATPSLALEYPCPADPGFCYFDTGNDGCFDAPTDAGPIDDLLTAHSFPASGAPVAGSIVCPPSVKSLKHGASVEWQTAAGGSVIIHGAKITAKDGLFHIVSGDRIDFGGSVGAHGIWFEAEGDVFVGGSLLASKTFSGVRVTSANGNVVIDSKVKIFSAILTIEANGGGDITVEDRAQLAASGGPFLVSTTGDVTMTNSSLRGSADIHLEAGSLRLLGKTKLKGAPQFDTKAFIDAAGAVEIERLSTAVVQQFNVDAGSIAIGLPGSSGEISSSKLTLRGSTVLESDGPIRIEKVFLKQKFGFVTVETTGTEVSMVDSLFRSGSGGDATVAGGPGSICDLTGSVFVGLALTTDCGTVVGP